MCVCLLLYLPHAGIHFDHGVSIGTTAMADVVEGRCGKLGVVAVLVGHVEEEWLVLARCLLHELWHACEWGLRVLLWGVCFGGVHTWMASPV